MHLIVDAHQDLAWNALTWGRDYRRSVQETRHIERHSVAVQQNGNTLLGLPEFLAGNVAVIFCTLFTAPARSKKRPSDALCYANSEEAHRWDAKQIDYYEQLVDECAQFALIRGRKDLEAVLATWSGGDPAQRRVGLIPLMEGADAIREPQEAEWWMEKGVRLVGLSWYGTRYAGGTKEPGPLTPDGRRLLDVMADLGLMLDLAHASDESFFEALDRFAGTVVCTHTTPRVRAAGPRMYPHPERFLSDEMIRRLGERGGVIGILPHNRFLTGNWMEGDPKDAVHLDEVVASLDHVCQVAGRADCVGIGSDFDGGFGVEGVPAEIDTVADLQKVGEALAASGYSEKDVAGVMGGNWLRVLRQGLPA
jgi:membrane dipeptidase